MPERVQISAVIPTYNRGHIVGRAIESVLAQEYSPSEIIVIDDGSADNTGKVVASYGKMVRYVFQANAGVSAARNRGVRESQGEWIAFLDSDDQWRPDHLKRIVHAINGTRGEAALYFADLQLPDEEGGHDHWRYCGVEIQGAWEFRRDAGDWAIMRIQPMMLQASVISRTAYWAIGGLPEHLRTREDTLLFFKLALLYPACAVAGCGTIMNSDDKIRLTRVYDAGSLVYCQATIFLYRELLTSIKKKIDYDHRRFLTNSLGAAYFAIGRVFFRQKKYLRAIRSLASSCFMHPAGFVKTLCNSLMRCLFKAKEVARASRIGADAQS